MSADIDTGSPAPVALDPIADALQRHMAVARAMYENGASEEVLRGWHTFAGWLRQDARTGAAVVDAAAPAPGHVEVTDARILDLLADAWHSDCPAGSHPSRDHMPVLAVLIPAVRQLIREGPTHA